MSIFQREGREEDELSDVSELCVVGKEPAQGDGEPSLFVPFSRTVQLEGREAFGHCVCV